ncbi:carbohydrate ABC transporter permease [uncultured Roseibium sp.]|uniref:carbohydrate ABC transporter permease n=1 Tax=uncultured Roseibium sp. TaxID=1936171 RepID=UPI0026093BE3|nr:carbohydrate ABC transporter permease [uncultured Roseibium sp.]
MATIEIGTETVKTGRRTVSQTAAFRLRVIWSLTFLMLLALVVLYPLWEIVRISLLHRSEVILPDASIWPLDLSAYQRIVDGLSFPRYFLNSLIVTTTVTAGNTMTAILAAYAFSRASFRGRDVLFLIVIGTLMIPNHITLIPNYLTFASFDMLDTYVCLILPFLASGFAVFFLRQHMMTIPKSLDEAARIDGASSWKILWDIVVPLSLPAISVVALFTFMSNWNEFIWPLLATTSDDMRTVQIGLRFLLREEGEGDSPDWPLVMAGTMITLTPLLLAYVIAERHLIRGITMGSLK